MNARAGTRGVLRAVVALSMLLGALAALVAPTAVAAQGAEGTSQLTVTVNVDGEYVEIREDISVEEGESTVTVQIPPTATDVDINGRVTSETSDDYVQEYDLSVSSAGASISYRLPGGSDARDDTRVSPDTVAFNLWPNMDTVSVEITMPEGYRATVSDAFAEAEIATDTYRYSLNEADVNRVWGLRFVALREDGLNRATVDIAPGKVVRIAGWIDDPDWLDYAVDYVENGIPLLEQLIGQPWPASDLELIESTAPEEVGYGGWYDLRAAQIEVDDDQDPELLLHELSHAYFNDTLFEHRWLIEGFAEAYAQEAVERLDGEVTGITAPGAAPDRFQGLNRWRNRFFFEDNFDEEIYGYRSSGYVVAELIDEIGIDRMAEVINQMAQDVHPYAVAGDDRAIGNNDWRRFLDLLELKGGSTEAGDLYRTYVVTDGQESLLDERRDALDEFLAFEADVAGGERSQVPQGIRTAMSSWEFDDATRGLQRAAEAQNRIDELSDRAATIGLALPSFIGDVYLDSGTDFARLGAVLDDADAVLLNFENRGNPPTATEERNFALGRFDQMDGSALPDLNALNQDGESEPFWSSWMFQVAMGAIGLLVLLAIIATKLPEPKPKEVDYSGKGPTVPSNDDIPVYRPQVEVSTTTPAAPPPVAVAAPPPQPTPRPSPPPGPDLGALPPPPDPGRTADFDPSRYAPPSP